MTLGAGGLRKERTTPRVPRRAIPTKAKGRCPAQSAVIAYKRETYPSIFYEGRNYPSVPRGNGKGHRDILIQPNPDQYLNKYQPKHPKQTSSKHAYT